jgi:hypothetical protein
MTHVLLDKREQSRKARPWITGIGKLYNDSQKTPPKTPFLKTRLT